MHRITLLAILLATVHLSYCGAIFQSNVVVQAEYPVIPATTTTDPTLVDQEDDDDFDSENVAQGSGCTDNCGWVRHHINGETFIARPDELDNLDEFLLQNEIPLAVNQIVASARPRQMEDGPYRVVGDRAPRKPETVDRVVAQGQTLDLVSSSNYYPEYAIGIMENGCTGFLISPFHLLTTAHCVYEHTTDTWNEELQFFRGRNDDKYLGMMDWVNVMIPYDFYTSGDAEHNWALITYNKRSPVWIRIGHTPVVSDLTYTLYGYLRDKEWGALYSTVCRSDMYQPSSGCIAMQCGTDEKINGGPVMGGYNFRRSKMPLAYGISINEDYEYAHNVVRFNSKLFWTLCYFMKNGSHDPGCKLQ